MNEIDDLITRLSAAYVVSDSDEKKISIDHLINMAKLLEKQFTAQIDLIQNSADELIKGVLSH